MMIFYQGVIELNGLKIIINHACTIISSFDYKIIIFGAQEQWTLANSVYILVMVACVMTCTCCNDREK